MNKFLIAPFDSGLQKSKKPFLITDDAFSELKNALVYYGRLIKRFGTELTGNGATGTTVLKQRIQQTLYSKGAIKLSDFLGTVTVTVGVTDGAGACSGTAPDGVAFRLGQKFVIDADTYTVTALGTPATLTKSGGGATTHTLDTTTGAFVFAGAAASKNVVFYPYVNYQGTLDVTGAATCRVPGKKYLVGQQFSIGEEVFTVVDATAGDQNMLSTITLLPGEYATFDCSTGIFKFNIASLASLPIYYYTNQPIMGFSQYETIPVTDQPAYAYDTQFVYHFTAGRWLQTGPAPAYYFKGNDSQFFYVSNFKGANPEDTAMFLTNFNTTVGAPVATDDSIWYFEGTNWRRFEPIILNSGTKIMSARIILPFRGRLLMFDTMEQESGVNKRYPYRCRMARIGSPIAGTDPIDNGGYAWLEPLQLNSNGGNYLDCTTQESIISAEYIRDRIIVKFERSIWELTYTGNPIEPFVWNQINSDFGSISTFGTVAFNDIVFSVSNSGIYACDGSSVSRIDQDIKDYVYNIKTDATGTARVHGIRDFKSELIYWTMPLANKTPNSVFPNTVLVYNYQNKTWSENDDCITAFGYFEQSSDKTWAEMTSPWEKETYSWRYYLSQAEERQIICGNHQGYIFVIKPLVTSNARVMSITNFVIDPVTSVGTVTSINHGLNSGDYVKIYDPVGITFNANDTQIYKVLAATQHTFTIGDDTMPFSGTYLGGGTISRISKVSIKSKEWNFYLQSGRNFMVNKMDFLVTRATGGLKTDFRTNSSTVAMADYAAATNTALGNNSYQINFAARPPRLNSDGTPNPNMESTQERVWRTQYFQADGNFIQLYLYFDDNMLKDPTYVFSTIEIHAIMISASPTGMAMEEMEYAF